MNFISNKMLNINDIKAVISTLSLQEQFHSFVTIVDTILCTESSNTYWDLISKNVYKEDYDKILDFLSPGGQFMNFLLKEMPLDKSMNSFEFPVDRLSTYTQRLIASNSAPMFISSKLQSKIYGQHNNVLLLNAFEYYIFSFFGYIYQSSVIQRVEWNGATDSIYCQLVFRYLDMFLFNCGHSSLLMQLAVQSRTHSSYNPAFVRSSNGSFSSFTVNSPFHDSILGRGRFSSKDNSNIEMAELYFTETIVQVINEFWLNFSTDSEILKGSPMKVGLSAVPNLSSRPTVDQVCMVRVFLKHTYHFCYANGMTYLIPGSQIECDFLSKVNNYRQKVLPKFLVSRLYSYLNYCFTVWPADLSFKIVLETWLSAIQPWRYTDLAHHSNQQQTVNDHDNSSMVISTEWTSFIGDNIDLYLRLLLSFARRMSKMDLTVVRSAQMLFRVAKVLSQSNLGTYMATRRSGVRQCSEDGLWVEIRAQIALLFGELDSTLVRLEVQDQDGGARGWIQTLWHSISHEVLANYDSPHRLITYLRQARSLLASVLVIDFDSNLSRCADRNDYLEYKHQQPEHVKTDRGSCLTEFGRFQVTHGLCRLDRCESMVAYYDRPVCSYEVGPIVAACSRLSRLVMSQCHEPIRQWCLRPDLAGRLARHLFIGQRLPASSFSDVDLDQWVDSHPPILRLRQLASMRLLFWSSIAFLVASYTLDLGLGTLLLLSLILYLAGSVIFVLATSSL